MFYFIMRLGETSKGIWNLKKPCREHHSEDEGGRVLLLISMRQGDAIVVKIKRYALNRGFIIRVEQQGVPKTVH